VIDGARQHAPELRAADALLERRKMRLGFVDGRFVVLGGAELEEHGGVVEIARELFDRVDLLLDARTLARDRLGFLRIVPKARCERLLFELRDLRSQLRKVKDAPLAP
jgi:hypothetical protein